MNSLRFRLIAAFSLVAIVPLAVAILLLSNRIQQTVREQAGERLTGALATLRVQLKSDADRMVEKLGLLGREPALKRLLLVEPPGADFADYLAERRFMLGLDFLLVADTSGQVVADAAAAHPGATGAIAQPWPAGAGSLPVAYGFTVEPIPGRAAIALAARAPILYRGEPAGMLRGGIALDAARLEGLKRASGIELALVDSAGRAIASTLADSAAARSVYTSRNIALDIGGPGSTSVRLAGMVSTATADQAVTALRVSALLLGLLGLALAVLLGSLWSLQISRPVEQLARFSERIARGEWDEPLAVHSIAELAALVTALERMRRDLHDYRQRLVASERHAAWSLMARKVAHEIKNPLTPIAISMADLKRSFDQKRPEFPAILDQAVRTIGEEVESLKALLQEFSELGRLPEPRPAPCRMQELVADLEGLYRREVEERRLRFDAVDLVFTTDRAQLRQALVNLVQNGFEAAGPAGRVSVSARAAGDHVEISVADDGPGLTAEQQSRLFSPDFTTKARGRGLGLTIVERIVHDLRGTITAESEPGRGATFRVRLPLTAEVP